ncbi:hypothetical protein GTD56_005027 [Salmonella enterica subsp. diarizonae]|nr:hypothetical protein [Salmonella enterica subsp. diarizonae]
MAASRRGIEERSGTCFFRICAEKESRKPIHHISICLASAYVRHTHIHHICICYPYTYAIHLHILWICTYPV